MINFNECRSVDAYTKLNKIQEGTYGVVYRAQDKETGEIVALKKVKTAREQEGFPVSCLREIKVMLLYKHPNLVNVKEVVVGDAGTVYIVMEYLEHDFQGLLKEIHGQLLQSEIKCLLQQLLLAVQHLHSHWLIHRDLKPANLLYNNKGCLKVADFGLTRKYESPAIPMTQCVVTLWYRAPELLLGATTYGPELDMWSVGCIFAEFILREPLFCGTSEDTQIKKIFCTLGVPNDTIWPGFSALPLTARTLASLRGKKMPAVVPNVDRLRRSLTKAGYDLLLSMLEYDPKKRISAEDALNHSYFREQPLPMECDMMPTWKSSHEFEARKRERSPDNVLLLAQKKGKTVSPTGGYGEGNAGSPSAASSNDVNGCDDDDDDDEDPFAPPFKINI